MTDIQKVLFELQDLKYRDFHSKLMPTIDKQSVIGVQAPKLQQLAKELYKSGEYALFLKSLPHKYYEENNLHAFLIMQIEDFEDCMVELELFLPYINNWATCDGLKPKALKKTLPELIENIKVWLNSDKEYVKRFAINMLMTHYLDDNFLPEYADMVANIESEHYYVNMMIAWYFATALSKQYSTIISYFENNKLNPLVHNKAIQKACESRRITNSQKQYLRKLKTCLKQ